MPLRALHHITVQTDDLEATRDRKGVRYRENHIASPPIDQLFFPDNNNVMVELNFPRA